MKYIKLFKNDAEYQAFRGGEDYITPNLCLNSETWETKCEPEEENSDDNKITFPIKLYEGYNNPDAANIIKWFSQFSDDNNHGAVSSIFFSSYPQIFTNPNNTLIINDKYYDVGVYVINNGIASIDSYTATEIGTDNNHDIMSWSLRNDGYLYIEWD